MNEKEKLKNLIVELYTRIKEGSIVVGAFGLSQDSVDFVEKLYKGYEKEGQESN